ncbi:MAG: arylsulfatase [Candidatus Omnitrophota bacterium]|jgi:choline-sulfatase|nr:MAG: arylsulfatase [Candidatus Omnitrophota bacterium]
MLQIGIGSIPMISAKSVSSTHNSSSRRPNILFIMADQFRGDCLSADGNPAILTPNLDRLGAEGIRFRRAYSCTPTCTPARSALLTGLGPWRNGMLGYGRVAKQYSLEKPRALREAGYYTFGIGKMHWHPQRNPHGFHRVLLDESGREESPDYRSDYRSWFWSHAPHLNPDETGIGWNDFRSKTYALPENLHPTFWTGECAVRFLQNYNQPEPFFLKVSFARPHSPYDPPERFMNLYENADIPSAAVGKWAERYIERSDQSNNIWHGNLGAEQVRKSRQGYYGSITFIDEQIGRILETVEKRGWLENTLIIFTADHGDMTGDHHLWRKSYAYEASARIPMLMRWPDSSISAMRGQVSERPVELRDILPTFLDAAEAPGADGLDGKSLLRLVRDPNPEWRDYIDLEHDVCYNPANHWNALTDGHYKYIFHARDGEEQLFDLKNDPGELHDLASDASHQSKLRKWRERMVEHLSERGEEWVKSGRLALRPERHLYSPQYPDL